MVSSVAGRVKKQNLNEAIVRRGAYAANPTDAHLETPGNTEELDSNGENVAPPAPVALSDLSTESRTCMHSPEPPKLIDDSNVGTHKEGVSTNLLSTPQAPQTGLQIKGHANVPRHITAQRVRAQLRSVRNSALSFVAPGECLEQRPIRCSEQCISLSGLPFEPSFC